MSQVVVLGGKSPIALAIARAFAGAGFDIVLVARDAESLSADEADIHTRYQVTVEAVELDINDRQALDTFLDRYREAPPEVVISVLGRQEAPERSRDDRGYIEDLVEGNLIAPAHVLERFASLMAPHGRGTLIGISSVAGDRGRKKNYTYGAAKAGFTAFLSGLRNRLAGSGVHVITVKPGVIRTPATMAMDHPAFLVGEAETVGADVLQAYQRQRNVVYTPWFWRLIMLVIRLIPERIFKRLDI